MGRRKGPRKKAGLKRAEGKSTRLLRPHLIGVAAQSRHAHTPKHQPNHLMLTNASPDPASQQPAASIALLKPAECFFFACFYPPGAINATAPRRTRHLPPEIPLRTVKKSTKITWPASCYYLFNWLSWVCQQVLQAVSFFQSRPESPSRPGLFFCGLLPWPGYYPLTDDKSAFEI